MGKFIRSRRRAPNEIDGFEAERPVLLAAVALADRQGYDTCAWQLPWALASFLNWLAHWHDWEAVQRIAVAAAQRLGGAAPQAQSRRVLGQACVVLGNYQDAHRHFGAALRLYLDLGDPIAQARTHLDIAWCYGKQSRHREGLDHSQQALRLSHAAGHRPVKAIALNAVGWQSAHLENYGHALASCQAALDLYGDLVDRHGQADAWDSLGYAHDRLREHAQAITCYEQALSLYRELGNRYPVARTLARLGDTRYAAGQPQAARDVRLQAATILDDLRHPYAAQVRATLRDPGATIDFSD